LAFFVSFIVVKLFRLLKVVSLHKIVLLFFLINTNVKRLLRFKVRVLLGRPSPSIPRMNRMRLFIRVVPHVSLHSPSPLEVYFLMSRHSEKLLSH
jgi:hypothetical protein